VFLTELVDAGLAEVDGWADEPHDGDANPLADRVRTASWPAGPDQPTSAAVTAIRAAAVRVEAVVAAGGSAFEGASGAARAPADAPGAPAGDHSGDPEAAADLADLVGLARLLLAERDATASARAEVAFPAHVSASGLVALAADRDGFALSRRRPVPKEPSRHARRGTRFHAWVERYFGASALLDVDDLAGAGDDDRVDDEALAALQETFLSSSWAGREPVAIEADVETPVGGVVVRCRIDAVFAEDVPDPVGGGTLPGAVVVDWKTGRAPHDDAARRAREVQLAAYRLAWSRWSGLPLEHVTAAFYYVADDEVARPVDLLGPAELEALVRGGPAAG
jgi:DNA helicase-2/ATP-dependent DNA helicase PcrA